MKPIKFLACLLTALAAVGLASCDKTIYDDEGDCVVRYQVRFVYDYNLKYADAFAHEVQAVTLYVVDRDGNIVWRKSESGPQLAEEGYAMEVEVAPGTYSLLAWCSSENPTTFRVGEEENAASAAGDAAGTPATESAAQSCRSLKANFFTETRADGSLHIGREGEPLDRLFHAYETNVEFPAADEGTFTHTLHLTKDTNHFVVSLLQLSGEPIAREQIAFEIIDDNAHLDWDNRPILGRPVTYHPWYTASVDADLSTQPAAQAAPAAQTARPAALPALTPARADNGSYAGVIAELTTSRLMYANRDNTILRAYRTDTGKTIVSIRLIDALLLVRGYENSIKLTEQQYLDYEDEYSLTFFLDENHKWLYGVIQIESWRVIYYETDLE